jgi:O-antigen/teichoic acid export membrane protein
VNLLKSKTGKQTIILFGSQIAMVGIGFGIKTLQTNYLGPELYGLYAFFGSFTAFTALFFRFGFFSSLQVLLAENKDFYVEKELFGLGFLINLIIGILYGIFIWAFSFYIDDIFPTHIGHLLRAVAPLTIIIPSRSLISAMTVGSNKIHILPIYDNVSKVLFLIALGLFALSDSLTVYYAVLFNLVTLIISFGVIYRQFEPSFKNVSAHFSALWIKTKSYGFNFYIGSTASQSTFKLDEMAITYFLGTTINGFYTLANMIAAPMIMGSQALSNSLFKDFSHQTKIPKKVFIYNTIWLLSSITILFFIAEWVVYFLFGDSFSDVSEYAIGISIAFLFQGLYQPYNFLNAKSQGKAVRNVPIVEAIINVVGNILLIPIYGVMGAIYTSIFAKFIHFIGKYYYYKKYLKTAQQNG